MTLKTPSGDYDKWQVFGENESKNNSFTHHVSCVDPFLLFHNLQCICFRSTSFSKKPKDAKQNNSFNKQQPCNYNFKFLAASKRQPPNPTWQPCFFYEYLSVPIDGSANLKFLALSRPNKCIKYRYWIQDSLWLPPNQFEWCNNCSCLRNDCNNDWFNNKCLCNKKCNNESATIPARTSLKDNEPKHSASHQKGG